MADWRAMAREALLLDGRIEAAECALIRKHLWMDGKIDREEFGFLNTLRKDPASDTPEFRRLFHQAIKEVVLADGRVNVAEFQWLRKHVLEDRVIDAEEQKLLREIAAEATVVPAAADHTHPDDPPRRGGAGSRRLVCPSRSATSVGTAGSHARAVTSDPGPASTASRSASIAAAVG